LLIFLQIFAGGESSRRLGRVPWLSHPVLCDDEDPLAATQAVQQLCPKVSHYHAGVPAFCYGDDDM